MKHEIARLSAGVFDDDSIVVRDEAMGAIVDGEAPIVVRNEDVIRHAGIEEADFAAAGSIAGKAKHRRWADPNWGYGSGTPGGPQPLARRIAQHVEAARSSGAVVPRWQSRVVAPR
jgi:hypothetical protein